jgi:hypothetical protein
MTDNPLAPDGPGPGYVYAVVEDDMSSPGSPDFMITQRRRTGAIHYTLARVYGESSAILIAKLLNQYAAGQDHPITKAIISGAQR